ncbi:MAG TPA: hypothetical protein VEG66_05350 [Thermoplasmata archaeon]|nr:hypothetical protein [Thermoplasmata archaeon]
MSAAAPPPAPTAPPKTATPPPPTPPRPRIPELHDAGTLHRDSVDADRWVVNGLVKVTGDVHLGDGKVVGTVAIGGRLSASNVQYRGTLDVDGAVEATGSVTGTGVLRTGATFHAATADLRGGARVGGAVTVDRGGRVRGSLTCPSAVIGELDLDGEAQIPGELGGLTIRARLKENSSFGTVRARSVVLRAKRPNLVDKVFFRTVRVTVERVEAETAELEGVDVTFVRSPQITLGPDAHVTEYEGTVVKRHPTSRVGFESKSPRPYGLRR